VNDIHIRYEDSGADPAHPFAMGIMLENFCSVHRWKLGKGGGGM